MSGGQLILLLSDAALGIYLATRHGNTLIGQAHSGEAACSLLKTCIAERPRACFHLLLDLADEDFRCESMPPLTGADRRDFLARKLEQFYPQSAFRHSRLLRHTDKTAPQQALLSAIKSTEDIHHLLTVLQQAQCALRGIFSQGLATHDLYQSMGYPPDCRLLISKNAHGLIRQSYFTAQGLRLSRLLPIADTSASNLASHTRQLHQYLLSINAITREQILQIHLLWDDAATPEFTQEYRTALQAESLPISLSAEPQPKNINLESKLISAIARGKIKNHYGSAHLQRYFLLRKLQQHMLAASALLFILGVLLGVFQHSTITEQQQLTTDTTRQIQAEIQQQHRLQADIKRIPATEKQEYIALYRAHLAHWPDVESSAQHISQILLDCPLLLINTFTWQAHTAPQLAQDRTPAAPINASVASANSTQRWQIITLNGQLAANSDDYRRLSADIDQCQTALASLPRSTVFAKKMPLDLRPQASISQQDGALPDATFSLQIVLAPTEEKPQ